MPAPGTPHAGSSSTALPLTALLLAALLTPSQACTVFEFQNDGFASNVLYLMRAIPIFYKQNGTLFLDNSAFPYACSIDGGFHDFFKYDEHLVPWSAAKEQAAGGACARVSFAEVDALIYNTLKAPHSELELVGVQRAWWYRQWVWQWIAQHRLGALQGAAQPTVGFHIRGGDVFEVDNEQARTSTMPEDYISAFTRRFPGVKGGTCLFMGDQADLLAQAAGIAEEAIGCAPLFGATYPIEDGFSRDGFAELDLDSRCEATLQLLGDMEVLSRVDYFVASYHSRWAKLVEWIRHGLYHKDRATALDASADQADVFSVIHGLFTPRSKGWQGTAHVAGDPELEVTELELEEAQALQAPRPKRGGGEEADGDADATPQAKGSKKKKKKKKKKHEEEEEAAAPAQEGPEEGVMEEAAAVPAAAVESVSFAEVAKCATQGCDDSQMGAREGAWSSEDATADDEHYATGSVHAGKIQGRRLQMTGSTQVVLQGRSYRVIVLEGCEYLIATDERGRLDLRDTYVHDQETDIFARPVMPEHLPDLPCRYAEVPWTVVFRGDTLASKKPWRRVEKVYLVEQREEPSSAQNDSFRLNLEAVFVLDRTSKDLQRGEVTRKEGIPEGFDDAQLLLRIRKDGLFLDRREDIPDVEQLVRVAEAEALEAEKDAIRKKAAQSMMSMASVRDLAADNVGNESTADEPSIPDEGQPQDPLYAMSENDFDGPDDTPAVDLGF